MPAADPSTYRLTACHTCSQVSRLPGNNGVYACSRCGQALHARKPYSVERAWALLITALVLFVPANLLPVMETGSLFGSQKDTIMSGVIYLWTSGSWPLAVVVFLASIVIPLAKIVILAMLLFSVQFGAHWWPYERTRLYRLVELIGRWSMLDIYVVTMLVALVQMQTLAVVHAGPGALAFGAVVVLTMLAAMAFDPRLIWDNLKEDDVRRQPHP
ncbi:MAG TPA: paraquat-inducible protein A [Methylophilaceae bacterium]|nr:paraquat-inducible protein A [Methylophilaceae bacterium]